MTRLTLLWKRLLYHTPIYTMKEEEEQLLIRPRHLMTPGPSLAIPRSSPDHQLGLSKENREIAYTASPTARTQLLLPPERTAPLPLFNQRQEAPMHLSDRLLQDVRFAPRAMPPSSNLNHRP